MAGICGCVLFDDGKIWGKDCQTVKNYGRTSGSDDIFAKCASVPTYEGGVHGTARGKIFLRAEGCTLSGGEKVENLTIFAREECPRYVQVLERKARG